jgi:hypothetical protein
MIDWRQVVNELTVVSTAPRTTGGWGIRSANLLPVGWVHIAHFDARDDVVDWFGPVLDETEEFIQIEVWESSLTFGKDAVLITRGRA